MTSDIAKRMIYYTYCPSDDCQISYFLRKNKIKVVDTLSLHAHEKAPTTVLKLMKQHSSWTKGGIHHYLEKERFTVFPLAAMSAYFLFSLINPLGICNIFLPLAFIFIWSSGFSANVFIARRGMTKSSINAVLYTLLLFHKGVVMVPYHILCFPCKRHSFWFKRTQYVL